MRSSAVVARDDQDAGRIGHLAFPVHFPLLITTKAAKGNLPLGLIAIEGPRCHRRGILRLQPTVLQEFTAKQGSHALPASPSRRTYPFACRGFLGIKPPEEIRNSAVFPFSACPRSGSLQKTHKWPRFEAFGE